MKVLIIGGVAAGTKTAAKLKRENRDIEVKILTKGKDISYAGCGLPYYVGGVIEDRDDLIVNTPEKFAAMTGAQVQVQTEVVEIDREHKKVKARNLVTGEDEEHGYDKLVIASGARPVAPPLKGLDLDHVYFMRTPEDAIMLRAAVEEGNIKRAVVCGGGFIGLEVAENLAVKGVKVSVIDMAEHILPGFDPEMADYVENHLADQGIPVLTGVKLEEILGDGKVEKIKTSKRAMKADAVILSLGIRANTEYLEGAGIELLPNRTVKVDDRLRTNDPNIYAVGDCASVTNRITGERAWSPMGSSANIEGRIAAENIAGKDVVYRGVLGTGVCKLPALNVGKTGLSESAAVKAGYQVESAVCVVDDKAHYYPGAGSFIIKLVAEKGTLKLLGLQVVGMGAVDKVVDVAATAITLGATAEQIDGMDLAYAPPFSTALHPITNAVNVLLNKVSGAMDTVTPVQYLKGETEGYTLVDAALSPSLEGAEFMDLAKVEGKMPEHPLDEKMLLICAKGKRAYMLQNRLKHYGYANTKVLEGGQSFNDIKQ